MDGVPDQMTSDYSWIVEAAVRKGGAAFNSALLALFLYAAYVLYGYGMSLLDEAGGIGLLVSTASGTSEAAAFALSPGASGRVLSYAGAWLSLIAAAGCGWMALLGLRWFFHAVLRAAMSLKL